MSQEGEFSWKEPINTERREVDGRSEGADAPAEEDRRRTSREEAEIHVRSDGYPLGHAGAREGKKEEESGHVSETELLIAHVLAAMKDCTLSSLESQTSSVSAPASPVHTSSQATARTSSRCNPAAQTSSEAKISAWASSQANPEANEVVQKSFQEKTSAASTSSQENVAARCITSFKHAHNKENSAPSKLNLDMQDERAHPKFRNLADLYKLSIV
eukprot:c5574_g1_i1 orf=96-743(+)